MHSIQRYTVHLIRYTEVYGQKNLPTIMGVDKREHVDEEKVPPTKKVGRSLPTK